MLEPELILRQIATCKSPEQRTEDTEIVYRIAHWAPDGSAVLLEYMLEDLADTYGMSWVSLFATTPHKAGHHPHSCLTRAQP